MRKSTKLPEGVGKKIIEALKSQPQSTAPEVQQTPEPSFDEYMKPAQQAHKPQQANAYGADDFDWDDDFDKPVQNQQQYANNDFEDDDFSFEHNTEESDDFVVQDNQEHYETYQQPETLDVYEGYDNNEYEEMSPQQESFDDDFYEEYSAPQEAEQEQEDIYVEKRQYREEKVSGQKVQLSPNPNSNVNILMNLVYQLPAGVTKQTGAQIIRQTVEAMGIPMNKVLSEAQHIQEELGRSIKDNINTIEEYRNNIKTLEKEVQTARNKCEELEELVSLFTLTDR